MSSSPEPIAARAGARDAGRRGLRRWTCRSAVPVAPARWARPGPARRPAPPVTPMAGRRASARARVAAQAAADQAAAARQAADQKRAAGDRAGDSRRWAPQPATWTSARRPSWRPSREAVLATPLRCAEGAPRVRGVAPRGPRARRDHRARRDQPCHVAGTRRRAGHGAAEPGRLRHPSSSRATPGLHTDRPAAGAATPRRAGVGEFTYAFEGRAITVRADAALSRGERDRRSTAVTHRRRHPGRRGGQGPGGARGAETSNGAERLADLCPLPPVPPGGPGAGHRPRSACGSTVEGVSARVGGLDPDPAPGRSPAARADAPGRPPRGPATPGSAATPYSPSRGSCTAPGPELACRSATVRHRCRQPVKNISCAPLQAAVGDGLRGPHPVTGSAGRWTAWRPLSGL